MKAAKRYAKALFELATDQLDTVQKDMSLLQQTFNDNPELSKALNNPTIVASKKLTLVNRIFNDKVSGDTQKLINLLGQKDRLSLLKNAAISFNDLYRKSKGIKEASVITAVPLDEKLTKEIFNKIQSLTGSTKINLTNKVDADIIGGFILNIDDLRYDASVSGKLAKIKSKLVE